MDEKSRERSGMPANHDGNTAVDRMPGRSIRLPLLAAAVGVICLLLWSATYTAERTVEMGGILFSSLQMSRQIVTRDCSVSEVLVSTGDHVEKGDVLAILSGRELQDELEELQLRLASLPEDSAEYESALQRKEQLEARYISDTVIRSTCAGQINQIQSPGSWLCAGETLVSVLPSDGYTELLAFVPLRQLNELSCGMTARIYPEFAPREKYGCMFGTISEIENIPATEDRLIELMGSAAYTEGLLPEDACAVVHIRVWLNSDSENDFYWSNENGYSLPVSIGTICSTDVITEEYHPISLLFP